MTINLYLELHPDQLTFGANVRTDLNLDDQFLKSVKVNGVIQPVVAFPDPDTPGLYRILAGHRRTAAAVQTGRDVIPVVVVPRPEDADRVSEQLVENIHRAELTVTERAAAYKQLALDFGLPATQIARRTATKIDRVGAHIKVASSPVAASVLEQAPELGLDILADIAEFDDDPQAVKELTKVAHDNAPALPHVIVRLRRDRDYATAKTTLEEWLTSHNIPIVQVGQEGFAPSGYSTIIGYVYTADPERDVDVADRDAMLAIPGIHAGVYWKTYEDRAEILWCVENNHHDTVIPRWLADRDSAEATIDPEEHQRRVAEQEQANRERQARDTALRDAAEVRTAFLRELLTRPEPKGVDHFLVHTFTTRAGYNTTDLIDAGDPLELLELPVPDDDDQLDTTGMTSPGAALADYANQTPRNAARVVLAIALAASEAEYQSGIYSEADRRFARTYLDYLKAWGYGPADIETELTREPETKSDDDE